MFLAKGLLESTASCNDVFCSTAYLGRGMLQFFSSFSLGCVSISFSPERDVLKSYRGDLTVLFAKIVVGRELG